MKSQWVLVFEPHPWGRGALRVKESAAVLVFLRMATVYELRWLDGSNTHWCFTFDTQERLLEYEDGQHEHVAEVRDAIRRKRVRVDAVLAGYKPVPVVVALAIADNFDKDVIVIASIDRVYGQTHFTTFGKAPADKVEAAAIADLFNKVLSGGQLTKRFEDFRHLDIASLKAKKDGLESGISHAIDSLYAFMGEHPEVPDEWWGGRRAVVNHLRGTLIEEKTQLGKVATDWKGDPIPADEPPDAAIDVWEVSPHPDGEHQHAVVRSWQEVNAFLCRVPQMYLCPTQSYKAECEEGVEVTIRLKQMPLSVYRDIEARAG